LQIALRFVSSRRNEARGDSDVDVFVDPAPDRKFGFLPFMEAYEALKLAIGEKCRLRNAQRPAPAASLHIEREAIRVF
jgi:predicted nucleotidyltransferase